MLIASQFLKNPGMYKSVSAFAPISNPVNCDWGKKAFSGYFGEDQKSKWNEHDASELIKQWKGPLDVLIDVVRHPYLCEIDRFILTLIRALVTTFTSRDNCSLRTSLKPQRKQAVTRKST